MTAAVAAKRGLRGFTRETAHLSQGREQIRGDVGFYLRRAKIACEERTIAQISVSHDGAYASAICIAIAAEFEEVGCIEPLIDDGKGPAFHERDWEDAGCFINGTDSDGAGADLTSPR